MKTTSPLSRTHAHAEEQHALVHTGVDYSILIAGLLIIAVLSLIL